MKTILAKIGELRECAIKVANPNRIHTPAEWERYIGSTLGAAPALLESLEIAMRALEKLKDGPGNRTAGWKKTWAHEFSGKAIAEIEAKWSGT